MKFNFSATYVQSFLAFVITALTVLFLGYEIGTSDSIEFIPYALTFTDRSLFPYDLFVNYHLATPFNERMFFAATVGTLTQGNEWVIFLLHLAVTLGMCWGVWKFCFLWLKSHFLAFIGSLLIIIGCSGWTLSCSEAYAGVYESSNITFALQLWALLFLLDKKWWSASLLTTAAVLIQPQLGLNFFMIFLPMTLWELFEGKKKLGLSYWTSLGSSLVGSIGYLVILWISLHSSADVLSPHEFIQIAYAFRLPHHVFPSFFPTSGIVLSLACGAVSCIYYSNRSTPILFATIIILLGACVYLLSMEIEFFWGISTWWMRMAIWLRLFGITAGLAVCQQMVHAFLPNLKLPASIGLLIVLTILMFSKIHGTTTFDLPNAPRANNERDICQKIKNKLPRTAVLVHPFEFTGVQYYGRVSTYVTFKAIPKRDDYLKLWYNRIVEVYQVDTNRTEKGFDLVKPANENYSKLSAEDLKKLKNEGVTHLITFSWVNYPSFRKIASNKQYTVYEL